MKNNLLLALILSLGFLFALPNESQAGIKKLKKEIYKQRVKDLKLGKNPMGRKFIVAIPPNEVTNFTGANAAMEIYIASAQDVDVKLTILGTKKNASIKAGEVLLIDGSLGLTKDAAEVRELNTATKKTITIEGSKPLSVYVMNSKDLTSDGYMAIPVSAWQKEYMHCSYYDNNEGGGRLLAGGFLVLASEDKTRVTVDIRGINEAGATIKGLTKSIGDQITFRLDEGEVYQIEGDGQTQGQFDISGTSITATKPIAIISYHWRTVIPIFAGSSRDHLCAMPMPVATWGKTYASIALERDGSKQGDLFRIMASEPNTKYNVKWYDFETRQSLGSKSGFLEHKGSWEEIASFKDTDGLASSITGTSIFEADKPVFIMQYSYSTIWDGSQYDPFMWPVTPVEQYITGTVVQAPENKAFGRNFINILALHDTTDYEKEGLKSLMFDKTRIVDKAPSFTTNQIPETNIYWVRFQIEPGVHTISGDGIATFGGYIYGFNDVDSYGWPAAMALKNLGEIDTMPPVLTKKGECGEWIIHVTELRNGEEDDDPRQVDSKVWDEPAVILQDSTLDSTHYISYNMEPVQYSDAAGTPLDWENEAHADYHFTLKVLDKFQDAKCYFYVADLEGNITVDSVEYFADKLELISPDSLDFGRCQIMEDHFLDITLKNTGNGTIQLNDISLLVNEFFSIVEGVGDYDKTELLSNEEMSLKLQYSPTEEIDKIDDFDIDSIQITAECLNFVWEMKGQGVTPKIRVEDWTIDYPVFPGNTEEKVNGITIENPGSAPLNVTAHYFTQNIPEFKYEPTEVQFTIAPKMFNSNNPKAWKKVIKKEIFAPKKTGAYLDTLIFTSNAFDPEGNDDSLSIWKAFSTMGNVTLSSFDFDKLHLGLKSDGTVTVTNTGTEAVMITKLRFQTPTDTKTNNFKFVNKGNNLVSEITFANGEVELEAKNDGDTDEATFNVAFVPVDEIAMEVEIIADYYTVTDANKENQEAMGFLRGQGTLPDVDVSEATFAKTDPVSDINTAERKSIFIKNEDEYEDLIINSITIDPIFVNDFIPLTIDGKTYDQSLFPLAVPLNGQVEVVYAFAPPNVKPGLQIDPDNPTNGFVYFTNITVNANHVNGSGAPQFSMIYSDYTQNELDPNTEEAYLKGFVVEGDANVNGIDYGGTMRCDGMSSYVKLHNLSQSQVLVIKDIIITDDDAGVFSISDTERNRLIGSEIEILGDANCEVIFDPAAVSKAEYQAAPNMTLDFSASVHMIYEFKGNMVERETEAESLTASARMLNVDISQKIDTKVGTLSKEVPIQPGMYSFNFGGNAPHYTNYFFISIDDVNDWISLNINSLSISYKYKKDWMGLIDGNNPFQLNSMPGFTVSKTDSKEEGEYVIDTYTISSTVPNAFLNFADKTTAFLNPQFLLYLSGDTKYTPEITEISFGTRDECITYTASTEEIPLVGCIQDINLISSTGGANLAPTLAPNPVVTNKATITYGVALNAQASLKVYNEEGKVVKVIVDSYQNAGTHTVELNTEDLPNGVYIIRLEQSSFVGEGSMVISK